MSFTPSTILGDIMDICEKHNETEKKNKFKRLGENIGYCAPEIRESRFWNGNNNWYGIIDILNKDCSSISDCNLEIDTYFKSIMKKYKTQSGFERLS
jgi:hypothetical protein